MSPRIRAAFVLSLLLPAQTLLNPGWSQCREWDTRFGLAGVEGVIRSFATFDDGHGPALYAGGNITAAGTSVANGIARWNGTRWSAVGTGIGPLYACSVDALAVFDEGSGPALYAAGGFTLAGGNPALNIAKWDGNAWTPLGAGLDSSNIDQPVVTALAVFDDGSGPALYAVGNLETAGGAPANHVARWDGTTWSPVGGGLHFGYQTGSLRALTVFDDGNGPALYAAGYFKVAPGSPWTGIAKWDGSSWLDLGPGIPLGSVIALTVFDGGSGPELIAGGSSVAAWDGVAWRDLAGISSSHAVGALAVYDVGHGPELFAAGHFTSMGGVTADDVARWNGSAWAPLDGRLAHGPIALIGYDDGSGPAIYVGGLLISAGGVQTTGVARWNGTSWTSVGSPPAIEGMDHAVFTLTVLDDGGGRSLYAGGSFSFAGGVQANGVARWRGSAWSALGSGVNGLVKAIIAFDDGSGSSIYVGGDFDSAGGIPAKNVAKWNGSGWAPLGAGVGAGANAFINALAVFDDGSGPSLFAAGYFSTAGGGLPAHSIAKWDGHTWSALGSGLDFSPDYPDSPGQVFALAVFDDGTGPALYAGGVFTLAGGVPARNIAKWNGASWSPVGSGSVNYVRALVPFDDGTGPALYLGSDLYAPFASGRRAVTKWSGTSWTPLAGGWHGTVYGLTAFDDGSGPALYAGGYFTSGTQPPAGLVRWNGASWRPIADGLVIVHALASYQEPTSGSPSLYAGGTFSRVGPVVSAHIARWSECDRRVASYCYGDGTSIPCPCANTGSSGHGCDNSASTGGARASATGSLSPDRLVITASGEPANAASLFFQSQAPTSPLPFGDGLRCTSGNAVLLFARAATGGTVAAPAAGDPSITSRSAALGDPILPGTKRHYQIGYRDSDASFCSAPLGSTFNFSNAIEVTW